MNAGIEKNIKPRVIDRRTTGAPIRALKSLLDQRLVDLCRSSPRSVDIEPKKVSTKEIMDEMLSGMNQKEKVERLNKILADKDSSGDMRAEARNELSRIYLETTPSVPW